MTQQTFFAVIKKKVKNKNKDWQTSGKHLKAFLLTFVDNWLDKLITCSRASVNSRFKRRTSFACRCSSVVEPYIEEPPDMSDIWLPCTENNVEYKFINSLHVSFN